MIDLHCHLLPGIDDGADTEELTLQMIHQAIDEGIETIVVTPHHDNGSYYNPSSTIVRVCENIQNKIQSLDLPITILPGQEVRITKRTLDEMEKGHLQTLADTDYILIELPTMEIPREMDDTLFELRVAGYKPILAHPERNAAIIADPNRLLEWVQEGLYSQITSHSLTGLFGKKIQRFSEDLLKNGLAHFIATDAHHVNVRNLSLSRAYERITALSGSDFSLRIQENSLAVIENEEIWASDALWKKKKWFKWW
jgi:protein-tyrosine phosphatase